MKGTPVSDKEYEDTQKMLDSFKPEKLHKKTVKKGGKNDVKHN